EKGITTDKMGDKAVTTEKIKAGEKGQLLITNKNQEVQWIDATDDAIKEILSLNQAITYIEDSGKGTFTYYNESCFDKKGVFIPGSKGVTFDANTLRIENSTKGTYDFYDKSSDSPIASIDIVGTVVENITEILSETTVKEEIFNTVYAQGKDVSTDKSITVVGGEQATLNPMNISVSEKGITTDKIGDKAVMRGNIGTYQVGNDQMGNEAVSERVIKDDAVIASKLRNNAVTIPKIKNGAVTTFKISSGTKFDDKDNVVDVAPKGTVLTANGEGGVLYEEVKSTVIDYSMQEQIMPEKWLDTDKKVAKRVFEVELKEVENRIVIEGDFASVILDAQLINQSTNSISRGVIRKEVVNGKTALVLGTPGLITAKHPIGKYFLILEYVKK
ncbi:MAG: hypothetical protein ACRCVU_16705, partial [Flavobacterium sp.]